MHQPEWQVRTHLLSAQSTAQCTPCLEKVLHLSSFLKLFLSFRKDICSTPVFQTLGWPRWQYCSGLVMGHSVCQLWGEFSIGTLSMSPCCPSESCVSAAPLMLPRWGEERRMKGKGGGKWWEEGYMFKRDWTTRTWTVQRKLLHGRFERRGEILLQPPLLILLILPSHHLCGRHKAKSTQPELNSLGRYRLHFSSLITHTHTDTHTLAHSVDGKTEAGMERCNR